MSTLQETLDGIKAASAKKIPEEARAVMSRATNDLRESGIMDGLPKVGDTMPAFELEDTDGTVVHSEGLLKKGPLVVSVYRGVW